MVMTNIPSDKISRIEVIDHSGLGNNFGRVYTEWFQGPVSVQFDLQDGGRTLKLFLDNISETPSLDISQTPPKR